MLPLSILGFLGWVNGAKVGHALWDQRAGTAAGDSLSLSCWRAPGMTTRACPGGGQHAGWGVKGLEESLPRWGFCIHRARATVAVVYTGCRIWGGRGVGSLSASGTTLGRGGVP